MSVRCNYSIFFTIFLVFGLTGFTTEKPKQDNKYLTLVRTFADKLLEYGKDNYGSRNTAMWASVIDLENLSVPPRNVPSTKGVRSIDRALGGSNYYHDVMTLKIFDALSEVTGDKKYNNATKAYTKDFLNLAQNPTTGLLGWGEHLYYDFYRDTVSIAESRIFDQRASFEMPHELLAWTPPWDRLWATHPEKTKKAIEGLIWHYNGPDTKTYLFNRHATWNKAKHQKVVMPWIKHSALYAYSFAFLYQKSGDEPWKKRAKDAGLLYWNLRDADSNLIFNCLYHESNPDAGKSPGMGSTGQYAYWIYKSGEVLNDNELKDIAKKSILAYYEHGWNQDGQFFYDALQLNGQAFENGEKALAWKIGYGSSSLFSYARAVTYMARTENDEKFLEIAKNCEKQISGSPLPEQYTAFNLGEAINFYIDLFELTQKKYYLEQAQKYADLGIANFSKKGLLSRQKKDRYYEAKLGIGDLLAGFFRLGMIESGKQEELEKFDFSY